MMKLSEIIKLINTVAYKDLESGEKLLEVLNFFTANNYRFLNRRLVVFDYVEQVYHDAYSMAKNFEENF